MPAREQREMHTYVEHFLEENNVPIIGHADNHYTLDLNKKTALFLHTNTPVKKHLLQRRELRQNGLEIADIFLKHPSHYHRFLSDSEVRMKQHNTLHNYTLGQKENPKIPFIKGMIHLRELEKIIPTTQNHVLYFQPETTLLPQELRAYQFTAVKYDYSKTPLEKMYFVGARQKRATDIVFPIEIESHPFIDKVIGIPSQDTKKPLPVFQAEKPHTIIPAKNNTDIIFQSYIPEKPIIEKYKGSNQTDEQIQKPLPVFQAEKPHTIIPAKNNTDIIFQSYIPEKPIIEKYKGPDEADVDMQDYLNSLQNSNRLADIIAQEERCRELGVTGFQYDPSDEI